jgi:hypothetical protein
MQSRTRTWIQLTLDEMNWPRYFDHDLFLWAGDVAYTVNIFISHSWSYSDHYDTLSEWLFRNRWKVADVPLQFLDFSVPKDDPIHFAPTDAELQRAIFQRIAVCHAVVIPTGMYVNYSKWIQKEIDGATLYNKPILAVNPWAQEKKSSIVAQAARELVGWNKESVVKGVWRIVEGI